MPSDFDLSREELLELLSAIPETVAFIDEDLTIRYLNRPEQEGYSEDDVRGAPALDFVPAEHQEALREHLLRVLETAEGVTFEVPIFDASDDVRWMEGTLVPVERDGRVVGVVSVTHDITARRLAEEEAEKLRRLVPICSWCGRVRSDEGDWSEIETYIEEHGDSRVTHGICPDCESGIRDNGTDGP